MTTRLSHVPGLEGGACIASCVLAGLLKQIKLPVVDQGRPGAFEMKRSCGRVLHSCCVGLSAGSRLSRCSPKSALRISALLDTRSKSQPDVREHCSNSSACIMAFYHNTGDQAKYDSNTHRSHEQSHDKWY